jgi:hypothetical protein
LEAEFVEQKKLELRKIWAQKILSTENEKKNIHWTALSEPANQDKSGPSHCQGGSKFDP